MDLTFGIEEEFFVVDERTFLIEPTAQARLIQRANELAGGGVSSELLQSQVETATPICTDHAEARGHLARLRSALASAGAEHGLSVLAAGTHPTAEWPEQQRTDKARYDEIVSELQLLAFRNLVCGMHVHVGIPDQEARIDVMRRSLPFLPILLALSCSSPFWRGMASGFSSYRLTAYEELPRTGLPPLFASWDQYQDYVGVLEKAGIIRNPSFIWWAVRPSYRFPTLELRIPDACTNVEDSLTIVALYRSLIGALLDDRSLNANLTSPERALVKENKWRVQRFGLAADLVDPFRENAASVTARAAARRLVTMLQPHAERLGCLPEIERVEQILANGTSADRQMAIFQAGLDGGLDTAGALAEVKAWLQAETVAGC